MNLFTKSTPKANPEQIQKIKRWTAQALELDPAIPISINQLQCHEPGCPPIETVIVLMSSPPQQYKIHKPISDITETDIKQFTTNN